MCGADSFGMDDIRIEADAHAGVETTPAWLDTESLLPASLRRRIASALEDAREVQKIVSEFADKHWDVFRDYAAATANQSAPPDVWEVLDRASGYAALWINVLAAEATLGLMLEVPTPSVMCDRTAR